MQAAAGRRRRVEAGEMFGVAQGAFVFAQTRYRGAGGCGAQGEALPQGAGTADGAALPKGSIQQRTDFGVPGWGGPCPPAGDKPHRYIFTVYALKAEKLDIPADGSAALVGFMINANKLGSATFTAKYGRSK